jgi:hypothetical protein
MTDTKQRLKAVFESGVYDAIHGTISNIPPIAGIALSEIMSEYTRGLAHGETLPKVKTVLNFRRGWSLAPC